MLHKVVTHHTWYTKRTGNKQHMEHMQDEWHVQHTQHIQDTGHTNEVDHNQHKGEHAKATAQAALRAHG